MSGNSPRSLSNSSYLLALNSYPKKCLVIQELICIVPPRHLFLHVPPTDPPRRIYRLADSPQWEFGRPRWMVL